MALSSLIDGMFALGDSAINNAVNLMINQSTNESNEKNVERIY